MKQGNQRTKGHNSERELVNLFKSYSIEAKRISMMETNHQDKGDIEVAGIWKVQVKKGNRLYVPTKLYDWLEGMDFACVRQDRKQWLIIMPLKSFIEKHL